MSFDELKEYTEQKNSRNRKILFGTLGVGLVVASILNAGHIENNNQKIKSLQREYIEKVCQISPEFYKEMEEYCKQVEENFTAGQISEKDVEKLLSIETVYGLAQAEECINKDLREFDRQISTEKAIKSDRVAGKYVGAIGGSGLLLYALSGPAIKLYKAIKNKISNRYKEK